MRKHLNRSADRCPTGKTTRSALRDYWRHSRSLAILARQRETVGTCSHAILYQVPLIQAARRLQRQALDMALGKIPA